MLEMIHTLDFVTGKALRWRLDGAKDGLESALIAESMMPADRTAP